jgi:SNF2 family DNA or RNA helicase
VRQLQAGLDRPVFIYNIVAKGTIDRTVLDAHENKISVQQALIDAAKRMA